jgi:hypothetical protein
VATSSAGLDEADVRTEAAAEQELGYMAQRLGRFAEVVAELIAGADCGFGSRSHHR